MRDQLRKLRRIGGLGIVLVAGTLLHASEARSQGVDPGSTSQVSSSQLPDKSQLLPQTKSPAGPLPNDAGSAAVPNVSGVPAPSGGNVSSGNNGANGPSAGVNSVIDAVTVPDSPYLPGSLAAASRGFGEQTSSGIGGGKPAVIGDQSPFFPQPFPPPGGFNPAGKTGIANNLVRLAGFKVSENQSPRPQDRVFFNFNYFNNVNGSLDRRLGTPFYHVEVFHYLFGLEKTIFSPDTSVGIRLPLNTIQFRSTTPGIGSRSTSLNDLSVYFKHVILEDEDTGSLLSIGLNVNAPTGPSHFAGSRLFPFQQSTTVQPFAGYIWSLGDAYVQGFTGIDVPTSTGLSTLFYSDLALGYFVYRAEDPQAWLSAIVPTFETHVNIPLSERGFHSATYANNIDNVNLVLGSHFLVGERSIITAAFASPVTGPKPFAYEFLLQLNFFFGGTSSQERRLAVGAPPSL